MVCGVWCAVLRQQYEAAVARRWGAGDRFRCMIDDCWWSGEVTQHPPLDWLLLHLVNTGVYSFLNIRRRTRDASGIAFYYIKKSLETLL